MNQEGGIKLSYKVTFKINDEKFALDVEPNKTLLEVLRKRLNLTGTKEGCGAGECGSCTVIIDRKPVNACMILAVELEGKEITTVEGLAKNGVLDSLQEAFINNAALQCGFCTPGMLMSAKALLMRNPDPKEEDIKEAIGGNLCRCTGYKSIIDAVKEAASKI
jgi:carbon-monoxide dehydrogenase small subunit